MSEPKVPLPIRFHLLRIKLNNEKFYYYKGTIKDIDIQSKTIVFDNLFDLHETVNNYV